MSIIGITGKIGSGKSTVGYLLSKKGYDIYNFADPIKKIGLIFGFSEEQMYGTQKDKMAVHPYWKISARQFMQKIGTELFRDKLSTILPEMNIRDTIWIELFRQKYQKNPGKYVIADLRFVDEAKMIKQMGGVIIRINRINTSLSVSQGEVHQHQHTSEKEIDDIKPDYVIDNNNNIKTLEIKLDNIIMNIHSSKSSVVLV